MNFIRNEIMKEERFHDDDICTVIFVLISNHTFVQQKNKTRKKKKEKEK